MPPKLEDDRLHDPSRKKPDPLKKNPHALDFTDSVLFSKSNYQASKTTLKVLDSTCSNLYRFKDDKKTWKHVNSLLDTLYSSPMEIKLCVEQLRLRVLTRQMNGVINNSYPLDAVKLGNLIREQVESAVESSWLTAPGCPPYPQEGVWRANALRNDRKWWSIQLSQQVSTVS